MIIYSVVITTVVLKMLFNKIVAVVINISVHKIGTESIEGIRKMEVFRYGP